MRPRNSRFRRTLPALLAAGLLLVLAATAHAGGWASTSFSPPPADLRAGTPWVTELRILQHGHTPLPGLKPAITTTGPRGRERRFDATATGEPGVYRVEVVFPRAGRYTYELDDGFTNAFPVRYPAVKVRPRGTTAAVVPRRIEPPAGGGFPWDLYLPAVAVLAAAGAIAVAATRFSGPRPV